MRPPVTRAEKYEAAAAALAYGYSRHERIRLIGGPHHQLEVLVPDRVRELQLRAAALRYVAGERREFKVLELRGGGRPVGARP